jgi:hypothetical protein
MKIVEKEQRLEMEPPVDTPRTAGKKTKPPQIYEGFELGPIRPPSEADSLMVRVTRNCSWNKCTFCGLYKGEKFSLRPKEHVMEDIRAVKRCVEAIRANDFSGEKDWAYYSALGWMRNGMESVFLQDANSMIVKPDVMVELLTFLRRQFPEIRRITSYARSHTISRIGDEDLRRIAGAGLNRIHIGMETASDTVLELVRKGTDKARQILAGQRVRSAGIELSEYYMPGLGGMEYLEESALETADALSQINPDFIRIRTLALRDGIPLQADYDTGRFTRASDVEMVRELRLMIANLRGIGSTIKSDHVLNLLPRVDGRLPDDRERLLGELDGFLALDPREQSIYRFGRRTLQMSGIDDLKNPTRRNGIERFMREKGVEEGNIDQVVDSLMQRFI